MATIQEIIRMIQNSNAGGALGNVSNNEVQRFQAAADALIPKQFGNVSNNEMAYFQQMDGGMTQPAPEGFYATEGRVPNPGSVDGMTAPYTPMSQEEAIARERAMRQQQLIRAQQMNGEQLQLRDDQLFDRMLGRRR